MDPQLTGRRAIVTGGSRGIGLAIARALLAEGVDVVIAARDAGALQQAETILAQGGGRVKAIAADTRDDGAVDRLVAEAAAWG